LARTISDYELQFRPANFDTKEHRNLRCLYNYRPHPGPLPQERETPWRALSVSEADLTNPALDLRVRLETILLLLGEKAGMRAVVFTISSVTHYLAYCGSFPRFHLILQPMLAD
jgi:hypothetical protein